MENLNKIAVLMGGPSSEREISLCSGAAVANGLRDAGYEVLEVDVEDHEINIPDDIDAAFIALHGEFGEDGGVQKLLEEQGVPYTGSGPDSSRVAFDKKLSKDLFVEQNIPTPEYEVIGEGVNRSLSLPVVIKPLAQGSSIGIHRISSEEEWGAACRDTLSFGSEMLVEAYIPGRELTVGVVGQEVLPVVEIEAPDNWYGYEVKYTKGACRYIAPAKIEPAVYSECQELALKTFKALGCEGMGRVDFRLSDQNKLYVLELNSIPGFTETSLLPMAAKEMGMDFSALCDTIIKTVLIR